MLSICNAILGMLSKYSTEYKISIMESKFFNSLFWVKTEHAKLFKVHFIMFPEGVVSVFASARQAHC